MVGIVAGETVARDIVVCAEIDDITRTDGCQAAQEDAESRRDIGYAKEQSSSTAIVEQFVGVCAIGDVVVDRKDRIAHFANKVTVLPSEDIGIESNKRGPVLDRIKSRRHEVGFSIDITRVRTIHPSI
jgi:hypothetical protein